MPQTGHEEHDAKRGPDDADQRLTARCPTQLLEHKTQQARVGNDPIGDGLPRLSPLPSERSGSPDGRHEKRASPIQKRSRRVTPPFLKGQKVHDKAESDEYTEAL